MGILCAAYSQAAESEKKASDVSGLRANFAQTTGGTGMPWYKCAGGGWVPTPEDCPPGQIEEDAMTQCCKCMAGSSTGGAGSDSQFAFCSRSKFWHNACKFVAQAEVTNENCKFYKPKQLDAVDETPLMRDDLKSYWTPIRNRILDKYGYANLEADIRALEKQLK